MAAVFMTLFLAQTLLALSMSQHFRTLNATLAGNPQQFRPLALALRIAGYAVLLVSLSLAIARWDLALGFTYWFGIFALTGLVLALGLEILRRRAS